MNALFRIEPDHADLRQLVAAISAYLLLAIAVILVLEIMFKGRTSWCSRMILPPDYGSQTISKYCVRWGR
jgi:hypothetical protein